MRRLTPGQAEIWIVRLDAPCTALLPTPTTEESDRAARFVNDALRRRYLRSHAALRALLARYTAAPRKEVFRACPA